MPFCDVVSRSVSSLEDSVSHFALEMNTPAVAKGDILAA